MPWRTLLFPSILFLTLIPLAAQPLPDAGRAVFRSNCAFCHGADGKGGRGPSLVAARVMASGEGGIRSVIKNGVPGTSMPAFSNLDTDDLEPLVKYIVGLAGSAPKTVASVGDAAAGKAVYQKSGCVSCHRIGLVGSVFGPELTRVGAGRSVEYLRESIVKPSEDIAAEYEGITVTGTDGKKTTGLRVNEDTFTVQLRLANGKFASFDKTAAKAVEYPKTSLMPAYKPGAADLNNLIAYLETLRGPVDTGADADKAKGIK